MPFAFDYKHKKIPAELDKRRKIPESEHQRIHNLYFGSEKLSQRAIASIYGGSRRLIVFILYPERYKQNAKNFKKNRKDGRYYNKDKWRVQMQKHRQYKQSIKSKLIK